MSLLLFCVCLWSFEWGFLLCVLYMAQLTRFQPWDDQWGMWLTSKTLFILLTDWAQAAKVSVGEKLFTGLFSVLFFTNEQRKEWFLFPEKCVFLGVLWRRLCFYSSLLTRTKWACPLFFSASFASFSGFSSSQTGLLWQPHQGLWCLAHILLHFFPLAF